MILRDATPADAAQLAACHVRIWRETYRDIAPEAAIAALDEARRLPHWRDHLTRASPAGAHLAEKDGEVLALIAWGGPRQDLDLARGEIRHLYVDARLRGQGVGRRLLLLARARLAEAGYPGAVLAVVEENLAARAFYAAMGGVEEGAFTDPGPLWNSRNLRVGWGA